MIKHAATLILLVFSATTGAHFFDGEDRRIDFTGEGYPFRAIGKLTTKMSNGNSLVCTAFLTSPSEITTARHCLIDKPTGRYVKEVFFELPGSPFLSSQKETNYRFRAQVPQYGERWKFETEGAVSLNLDLESRGGPRLGDLVGYFGVSGLGTRRDGYEGKLPNSFSSKRKRNFCKENIHGYRPLDWLHVHNELQHSKEEEWTATPEEQKTIVRLCSAGFSGSLSKSHQILMVENDCGLGGALFDGARTTCWTSGGTSGGPLFYHEDGQYYAIAVHSLSYPTAQNAGDARKSPDGKFLIGEPFGSDFFNWAALIIQDVYEWAHSPQQKGFYAIPNVSPHRHGPKENDDDASDDLMTNK